MVKSYTTVCSAVLATVLAGVTGAAQAALVNFNLTGTVTWADPANAFGLSVGDNISGSGTFDDAVLTGGTGTVSFANGSGNSLTLNVGSFTFNESDAIDYNTNRPEMDLSGGTFAGLRADFLFGLSSSFTSMNYGFNGFDDDYNYIAGDWAAFEMSPVPVPAAVWLFGSGLLGLVGVARRHKRA